MKQRSGSYVAVYKGKVLPALCPNSVGKKYTCSGIEILFEDCSAKSETASGSSARASVALETLLILLLYVCVMVMM